MAQVTYVLKTGENYLKVPFQGSSSIFTTSNILECIHFLSPAHAEGFLTSIFTLPDHISIESTVNFHHVNVVKAVLNVTEEPINAN